MSKVIVLTGAGGVLCSTLAIALAKEGHKIAVLDIRIEAANKVVEQINSNGGTAIGVAANVLEKDSLERAKKEVNERFGLFARYNAWDNNAGDDADTENRQTNFGLNYWPHEDVVFKFDIENRTGAQDGSGFNLGVGYQF